MKHPTRRWLLGAAAATGLDHSLGARLTRHAADVAGASGAANTTVSMRQRLVFPRDAGAHLEFKTEWWYVTGWATAPLAAAASGAASAVAEAAYGFQVTFFRSRVEGTQGMQSRLAARQLLFAHAAVSDVQGQRLWHDQRIARWSGEVPGNNPADTASASTNDTGVLLRDWSLLREGSDLRARLRTDGFAMDLRFSASQPVLLQGDRGLSRKGPDPRQSSYYYSLPQLHASGTLTLQGKSIPIGAASTAWLDHEWSDEVLPTGAVGWDWIGINLFDGSALTAFRLRGKGGDTLWDGGSFRAGTTRYVFSPGEAVFKPLRIWHSPSSRASYPVEWMVRTPADFYTVRAVLDNQELDSRNSTGAIYWEGLCDVWDSNQRKVGRGYLEMTGYAAPLKM
jgi:predicted secreted hydrolase